MSVEKSDVDPQVMKIMRQCILLSKDTDCHIMPCVFQQWSPSKEEARYSMEHLTFPPEMIVYKKNLQSSVIHTVPLARPSTCHQYNTTV